MSLFARQDLSDMQGRSKMSACMDDRKKGVRM